MSFRSGKSERASISPNNSRESNPMTARIRILEPQRRQLGTSRSISYRGHVFVCPQMLQRNVNSSIRLRFLGEHGTSAVYDPSLIS